MISVRIGEWLGRRQKWLVTVATFFAGVVDLGYAHGDARMWFGIALLALNSAGVHQIRNSV